MKITGLIFKKHWQKIKEMPIHYNNIIYSISQRYCIFRNNPNKSKFNSRTT